MKLSLIHEDFNISLKILKNNRVDLSDDELKKVKEKDALWSDDVPAVWKAIIKGNVYYFSHTHRTYSVDKSLLKVINDFHDYVKESS